MEKIKKDERVDIILKTFESFGIKMESVEIMNGSAVSYFVFKLITPTRMKDLDSFDRDLCHALAVSDIRIDAPIRNSSLIGIEVPEKERKFFKLRDMLKGKEFAQNKLFIPFGRTIGGEDMLVDLYTLPHLLITGTTGSGKSNFLNCLINSLTYKMDPTELKFILVDPKRVEFSLYAGLPHLLASPIVDCQKAISALRWMCGEMERRYKLLSETGTKNIENYNQKTKEKLPYVLYVVDEFVDLFYADKKSFENVAIRVLQMGRAVGCHVIMATSRPSKEIMNGLLTSNMPSRLALNLCCVSDSKAVLGRAGAEKLLREGDALFSGVDDVTPVRIQIPRITEEEIISNVKKLKKQFGAYEEDDTKEELPVDTEEDPLYEEAKEIVIKNGKASSSFLQRKLRIGYSRAARLIDMLEESGVVGEANGAEYRKVLI